MSARHKEPFYDHTPAAQNLIEALVEFRQDVDSIETYSTSIHRKTTKLEKAIRLKMNRTDRPQY